MHQNAGNCIYIFNKDSGGETPRPPGKMCPPPTFKMLLTPMAMGHLHAFVLTNDSQVLFCLNTLHDDVLC